MKTPIIALVGQTNAGKSSLLNRLARKNIAIVAREEGTTRDSVVAKVENRYIFIDTAGLKDPSDDFEASIQDQIDDAINSADLIAVVLDSSKYPDQRDKQITKNALKSKKPVLLVLNKFDLGGSLPVEEFISLGIKADQTVCTSATTGQGIASFLEKVDQNLVSKDVENSENLKKTLKNPNFQASDLKIALIGRPNVGKSSLFNSLGRKQQAIVSPIQGTTRDINRIKVKFKGQTLEFLDTAGLRRPGKREVGIEKFSAIRTLAAIEEADICALLIDATNPHAKLDQSLAGQIVDAGKGIILIVTKSDLLGKNPNSNGLSLGMQSFSGNLSTIDAIIDNLERDFNFLPYAPVLVTSSKTGENVTRLFDLALEIQSSRETELKTADLNKILQDAILGHPPAGLKNTRPSPKYLVQTDTCPPWFVLHGHNLTTLHWSWKRFLERKIREFYPFIGTPIKISYHDDSRKG